MFNVNNCKHVQILGTITDSTMCLGHIVYSLLLRRVGPCLQGTLKFLEGTSGAPFGTFYEGKKVGHLWATPHP
jgi:hypothetical protein